MFVGIALNKKKKIIINLHTEKNPIKNRSKQDIQIAYAATNGVAAVNINTIVVVLVTIILGLYN